MYNILLYIIQKQNYIYIFVYIVLLFILIFINLLTKLHKSFYTHIVLLVSFSFLGPKQWVAWPEIELMGQKLYPTCLQKMSFFPGLVQCLALSGVGSLSEGSEALIKKKKTLSWAAQLVYQRIPHPLKERKNSQKQRRCVLSLQSDTGFRFEPDCLLFRQNLLGMATWFWPAAFSFSSPGPMFV